MGYGVTAFTRYLELYGRNTQREDLLSKLLIGEGGVGPPSDPDICTQIGTFIIAGTDTTSISLTFFLWELAKHPEIQSRMREEFRVNQVKFIDGVPHSKDIAGLKLLDAVLFKSLRLHPSHQIAFPRVSPKGGGFILTFVFWTTLGIQNYDIHYHPHVFASLGEFRPDRWLDTNGGTPAMREAYIPWFQGSRACVGRHLATIEMKLLVASIVHGYYIKLAEGITEESMMTLNRFVALPRVLKCDLFFDKIEV
ncbi:MAG: hypothetical protein M1827_002572 [Pycnora praestabilis]|nr:MAG: hypothetical protein M1827_002572 [Pycnora praestabilis]